jgi:hypothetical protein
MTAVQAALFFTSSMQRFAADGHLHPWRPPDVALAAPLSSCEWTGCKQTRSPMNATAPELQ